jgi:hypothetical protein
MLSIFMQGALEPIEIKTSMTATVMNMSAAMNQGVRFWGGRKVDGTAVLVAIDKVLYMEEDEEEVGDD